MWQQSQDIEGWIYMSRIEEAFQNTKAFIGFLTAGDPSLDKTEEYIVEMERAGAALIEIGIPFSDPIAEGTVISEANVRALSVPGGCTTDMVFDMVERVSKRVSVPLVLSTYLNPVFKYGYEAFCKRCSEVGISGILIPDMPYEEKEELVPVADKYDVDVISMIAPAGEERIRMIAKEAKGFIYVVSPAERKADVSGIVEHIRQVTDTPVVIGTTSGTCEQIGKDAALADGCIAENAIVKIIGEYGENAGGHIYDYVKSVVEGMNQ